MKAFMQTKTEKSISSRHAVNQIRDEYYLILNEWKTDQIK